MAPTYPPNFVFLALVGAEIFGGATSAPPSTGRSTRNPSTARVKTGTILMLHIKLWQTLEAQY